MTEKRFTPEEIHQLIYQPSERNEQFSRTLEIPTYQSEHPTRKPVLGVKNSAEPTNGRKPFPWVGMSNWDNEPVPEREWAIKDRVPLRQVGLFSGEGGTGKSIIELMKKMSRTSAEKTGLA
jgi:hypothetical protein